MTSAPAKLAQLSDEELRDATEEVYRRLQRVQAEYLEHLLELDSRPSAVPGARAGQVGATFARYRLNRSRGAADVRAARALLTRLPGLGAAFAAGEVSREHVDVAVQTLTRIPRHLLDEDGTRVDRWFVDAARELPPPQTDTAADGAAFRAALDALSAPTPVAPESQLPVSDTRSMAERHADALGQMARLALAGLGHGFPTSESPGVGLVVMVRTASTSRVAWAGLERILRRMRHLMWGRRLTPRAPIRGYLCGAGTHPAGSVIATNGRNAAAAVLADLNIPDFAASWSGSSTSSCGAARRACRPESGGCVAGCRRGSRRPSRPLQPL